MSHFSRQAKKELSRHETTFTEGFDTILADVIHDRLREDEQLRQVITAYTETEAALSQREDEQWYDDAASEIDDAVGRLRYAVRRRVREVVAELCSEVICDAGSWTDVHDEEDLRETVEEAREWLSTNSNAAERAGVAYGSELPETDELFEEVEA